MALVVSLNDGILQAEGMQAYPKTLGDGEYFFFKFMIRTFYEDIIYMSSVFVDDSLCHFCLYSMQLALSQDFSFSR